MDDAKVEIQIEEPLKRALQGGGTPKPDEKRVYREGTRTVTEIIGQQPTPAGGYTDGD